MTSRVTRNQILNAIDRIVCGDARGLCGSFHDTDFQVVQFIEATGGKERRDKWGLTGHYWSIKFKDPQRLMFLAFMLTWQEDIENGKR